MRFSKEIKNAINNNKNHHKARKCDKLQRTTPTLSKMAAILGGSWDGGDWGRASALALGKSAMRTFVD